MLPKGFLANGLHCGIAKKKEKKDLAVFYTGRPAVAAGMFTANLVKAAPVLVSRTHLAKRASSIRAVVANSGCANACTGQRGRRDAGEICASAATRFGVKPEEVLVASTGVIGQYLPVSKMQKGIAALAAGLKKGSVDGLSAAEAIMTTDTFPKTVSRSIRIGARTVTIWGCAKGAGMIHPELVGPHATMLSFILTDVAINAPLLGRALNAAVGESFNCVSVDGDTSTNDTILVLANGAAENPPIVRDDKNYKEFSKALKDACLELAKMLARDGEGATTLVAIEVRNAASETAARKIAATIATSPLVKTAVFGRDANWGRIIAAAGRAGVPFNPETVDIYLGGMMVARRGMAVKFSEAKAKKLLGAKEIAVTLDLCQGSKKATYYTCDFSFDYVKINASYRS